MFIGIEGRINVLGSDCCLKGIRQGISPIDRIINLVVIIDADYRAENFLPADLAVFRGFNNTVG